jgi:membrane dipeptidase
MRNSTFYQECLIWDDHCGFELQPDASLDPLLAPWRDAGVDYLSISVAFDPQPWYRAVENIAAIRRRLPIEAPYCRIISSVKDIDRARADGKMAVAFDVEGMNALNGRLDLVQFYYEIGVRHMLFAYNCNNLAGSGCHDEDNGLTVFGRHVVDEMNRVGMVVDCSHCSFKTTMEAIERSSAPVVFSHSNPKALVDHDRNVTDTQIKACADTGGVLGINGINLFLGEADARPETVARHAAYVANLTGPQHVGISLDYAPDLEPDAGGTGNTALMDMFDSHPGYWPDDAGYDDTVSCLHVGRLPEVAAELLRVGFDDMEVEGILGRNFRRVAENVWK